MVGLLGEDVGFDEDFGDEGEYLGHWAGLSAAGIKAQYQHLKELGTLSSAQYIVRLRAFDTGGNLDSIGMDALDKIGWAVEWLAQSCSVSILDAQSDSVQVGHFQQNFFTGANENDVDITFLETKGGNILNFASAMKEQMFNPDGTQGLPNDYMMWLSVSLFNRTNRDDLIWTKESIVALKVASVELAANSPDLLSVPLTFMKMYPMIK